MDLHAAQIQGFFNIPVDHLLGAPLLSSFMKERVGENSDEYVVVSPDLGSVTRARNFAARIGCSLAIVDKRRQKANVCEVMNIIGSVEGKKVILVDDMIDTAGTLCNAAAAIMEKGAKDVTACATHAVLSGPAIERIRNSAIKELVLLDTIPLPEEKTLPNFTVLPVAQMCIRDRLCVAHSAHAQVTGIDATQNAHNRETKSRPRLFIIISSFKIDRALIVIVAQGVTHMFPNFMGLFSGPTLRRHSKNLYIVWKEPYIIFL